jgi:hypothetical protein
MAQEGPPVRDPVERMTPPAGPTIAINHLGFRPVVPPFRFTRPPTYLSGPYEIGGLLTADFSDLNRPGLYQISIGDTHSVQFAIRAGVWRRTIPKAVGYYRYQRCGVDVPGVHPACHLDDARRRDNGQHVEVTGGWHDAGDLRNWMDVSMLNGIALLNLTRNIPEPAPGDVSREQVLEEVPLGNTYFLKVQDTDGKVWADTPGGVNGDNSDNHWTDKVVGTADDRYINVEKGSEVAAVLATLQGLVPQSYAKTDPDYAKQCLHTGVRAWNAFAKTTLELAWWAMATCELFRATQDPVYRRHAALIGRDLVERQNRSFIAEQQLHPWIRDGR